MSRTNPRAALATGLGLVLVTNLALLAAAAWNRRGEPEATLPLTERELPLPPYAQEEKSDLVLPLVLTHQPPAAVQRVAWRMRRDLPTVEYAWLDRAKLRELGFRVPLEPTDPEAAEYYAHASARRAWIVLEFDGDGWRRWLAGREEETSRLRLEVDAGTRERSALEDAETLLTLDRTMRSRLYAVDAGTDPGVLRRRYPDRRRCAVVEGLIDPRLVNPADGPPYVGGRVVGVLAGTVHVPRRFKEALEPFLPSETRGEVLDRERREGGGGWPPAVAPRYRAEVAFGRRHEPWLASVSSIGSLVDPPHALDGVATETDH